MSSATRHHNAGTTESVDLRVLAASALTKVIENFCHKKSCAINVSGLVKKMEETIYLLTIRALVQSSDANFRRVYDGFFSNLKFNLTEYKYSDELVTRIIENPSVVLNAIIINGPLELNRELEEVRELQKREEDDQNVGPKVGNAPNVHCPKCGTKNPSWRLVQKRSSDEGMNSVYSCLNKDCGYEWTR